MATIFIAGIDTDTGKSVATGCLARYLKDAGKEVITQKLAQTGCSGISDDIKTHRKLMGVELNRFDEDGTTCPYVFSYPASPHLAAELDNKNINIEKISLATDILELNFEYVLVEGVGGLHVPLLPDYTTLDYLLEKQYPVILVTSSKLGSINHTLLTLEVLKNKDICLIGVVYNNYPNNSDLITRNSSKVIRHYTNKFFPEAGFCELKEVDFENVLNLEFKDLFKKGVHSF